MSASNAECEFRTGAGKPCPVCSAVTKGCSVWRDDKGQFILCRDACDNRDWRKCKEADNGFGLYRRREQSTTQAPLTWHERAERYARNLTSERKRALADKLQLPVSAIEVMPWSGWTGHAWSFPEYAVDAQGKRRMCGISLRYPDGTKKMCKGSKRGLTMLPRPDESPDTLLIVEGTSDCLAVAHAGLWVIARPSNVSTHYLPELLHDLPADVQVLIVGENDAKADGAWPGRDGAQRSAGKLARALNRPISWALVPDDCKDSRAWLAAQLPAMPARECGLALLRKLNEGCVMIEPAAAASVEPGLHRRVEVILSAHEHFVNRQVMETLPADSSLFQRGGVLVQVHDEPTSAEDEPDERCGPRIVPVARAVLRDQLTQLVDFQKVKQTSEGEQVQSAHPPDWCVGYLHAVGQWPGVRTLEGIAPFPLLRPDGSLILAPGYDADTGLYLAWQGEPLSVPEHPTRADAVRAVGELFEVIADFPFAAPEYRSAWLAALLTPLARPAFSGCIPLFLVDANVRGAGKGLLLDCISRIITGHAFSVSTYTHDTDELRKRITTLAINGDRMVLFDNLEGNFGNAALDAALTAAVWQDRILGSNQQVSVPLPMSW